MGNYITDAIDDLFDVSHLRLHFLSDNPEDKRRLDKQAELYCTSPPPVIISKFDENVYDQFQSMLEDNIELANLPPPVLNCMINFGKITPVSIQAIVFFFSPGNKET